nr:cell division protein FtsQ [Bacteroides sp. 224]
MKKILLLLVMLLIMGYLVVAITAFNVKPNELVCKDIELLIKDSVNAGFVTKKEVTTILKKKNMNPVGQCMESIDSDSLEKILSKHHLIDEVECYKTPSGKLCIEVTQRVPILRIMSRNGENYYIDNKGNIMPSEAKCIAHLAVVTGNADKKYVIDKLYPFALFMQKNKFWNAQIEQINIVSGQEVELVPRVGDHIIFLGKIDNYENKLSKLKEFYRKGLNKVGWNKYSRISVEFENQIICTKKEN